jgi:hypothetical protein
MAQISFRDHDLAGVRRVGVALIGHDVCQILHVVDIEQGLPASRAETPPVL